GQYESAMKLDPNDERVHAELAGLYLRTRKYNESAKEWMKVIQIDSNYADAYRQIATLYVMAKQFANAVPYARKYSELKPDDIEGQWLYAQALAQSGAYTQALPMLEAVSANDSLRPLAQRMLARAYFYSKNYPKAIEIYKGSPMLGPEDLSFYGDALIVAGDTAGGIEQLKKSLVGDTIRTPEEKRQTESAIGQLLYQQKRYEESAEVFAHLAEENPSADAYLSAGQIYSIAKRPDLAQSYYSKALALSPNSLKVRMQLAIAAQSQNAASDTALHAFEDLKNSAETSGNADTAAIAEGFIGYYYIANKDWKKSVENLEPAVKTLEKDNSPYLVTFDNLLAGALIQEQDLTKARMYYEKILKIDPNNQDAKKGIEYIEAASHASGGGRKK